MSSGSEEVPQPQHKHTLTSIIAHRAVILDILLKYFTVISTIIAGFFGIWKYLDTKKAEVEQQILVMRKSSEDATRVAEDRMRQEQESIELRRKEFRLRFFEREMELYLEACRATATLANAADPKNPEVERAVNRFYALFWGELCVVEDPKVESAMISFEKSLRAWRVRGSGGATEEMRRDACSLALQCRESLEGTFDLNLGVLPGKPHASMMGHDEGVGKPATEHEHHSKK